MTNMKMHSMTFLILKFISWPNIPKQIESNFLMKLTKHTGYS